MRGFTEASFTSAACSYILPSELPVHPLSRISPSKFHLFRECRLRACLESNRLNAMLPVSPSAHFGTIIHKVIEMTVKEDKNTADSFEECWQRCLKSENNKMKNSWLERHLVPLENSISGYGLKKHQCYLLIKNIINNKRIAWKEKRPKGLGREVWLETRDKIAGGFVDAIISTPRGDVIVDYKTGNIFENADIYRKVIKETYKNQLRLYAAIYNSVFGIWPISLKIGGVDGILYEIDYDKNDCTSLLNEVRQILIDVNSVILEKIV